MIANGKIGGAKKKRFEKCLKFEFILVSKKSGENVEKLI
jgi:hypothetical protein